MANREIYGIITGGMARSLVESVSAIGKRDGLTRRDLRDAMWVLDACYESFGMDEGYDALVDMVMSELSRMAYSNGADDGLLPERDRQWLAGISDTRRGTPYGDFLAGAVPTHGDDDDIDELTPPAREGTWEATLTKGQREAYEAVRRGENVFLTGNGGTGKSYLVNGIIDWARGSGLNVLVCAPTGIAAINVGGATIHRTLSISPDMVLGPKRNPSVPNGSPVPKCDLMIVDEISMCRVDLFDYLSSVLRAVGRDRQAQGLATCQLVVVGDFFQLPPVVTKDDRPMLEQMYGRDMRGGYPFMGDEWDKWEFRRITLTETIRQRDGDFVAALDRCRVGDIAGARWIESHASKKAQDGAIILCGTNSKANEENGSRLGAIKTNATGYRASMWGDVSQQDMPTEVKIRLKPGARVMSVVNDPDETYMNGTLGTVEECRRDSVVVAFDNGSRVEVARHTWNVMRPVLEDGHIRMETVGEFIQIPLRLAWAITIHKSQGQTFDRAVIYPYSWDYGQLYTALSRLTDVRGMTLAKPIQTKFLKASPDVLEFEERYRTQAAG